MILIKNEVSKTQPYRARLHKKNRAGSLNQGATNASSEAILKAAHLRAIFKRKMAVVSQNYLETPPGALAIVKFTAATEPLVFPARRCLFSFKDPCFIGSTG